MPAIAASTCSQAPASWQIVAISGVGSNAIDEVVPRVAHTKNGVSPAARSAADQRGQRLGAHREVGVVVDDADRLAADAGDAQRLLDARVGVRRGVGDEPGRVAVVVDRAARRPPAGRQHGDERRLARRALDDATAGLAGVAESLGQIEQLGHPVDDAQLQLGARRRRDPAHPVDAEPGRQQLAEDRGVGAVGREVGEEARVLPVHQAGHDDAVDVGEHGGERLGLGRGVLRQLAHDVAGLHVGRHRPLLDRLDVVGDPVDESVPGVAELLRRHRLQYVRRGRDGGCRSRAGAPMATSPATTTPKTTPWRHPPRSLLPHSGRGRALTQSVMFVVVSSGKKAFSVVGGGVGRRRWRGSGERRRGYRARPRARSPASSMATRSHRRHRMTPVLPAAAYDREGDQRIPHRSRTAPSSSSTSAPSTPS